VVSITSLKIWNTSTDVFITEASTYYELINGRYIQYPKKGQESSATYSSLPVDGDGEVKVSYVAGFATSGWESHPITNAFGVAADLEWAVCGIAAIDWSLGREDRSLLGIVSRSMGAESMSYESFEKGVYPDKIMRVFDRYKRLPKF